VGILTFARALAAYSFGIHWEGSVSSTSFHRLFPIGTFMLAAGLVLHIWTHGRYTEFTAGFLIGMSIVFMIAAFVRHSRVSN
jgi:hypothetical protein